MRKGQEAARRFHEEPERSSDFLCLPDLKDFLFCLRKKRREEKDDDFRLMLRFRLGLDTFSSGICSHVNQDGVACG